MKKDDKNLDFNLEFLDKESSSSQKPKTAQKSSGNSAPIFSAGVKDKLKLWGIGIAVVVGLVFFGALFSDDSSSSSNYTPPTSNSNSAYSSDDDLIQVGEYMCSRYHYNKATELEPDESSLTFEQNLLINRGNEVDRLANELEYSYVNEYSAQWEIDEYNAKVAEYNRKLTSYNRDADSMDSKIDRHNGRVEIYNNYLIQNCTPNR